MEKRLKSPGEKKLEKALNISDDDINSIDTSSESKETNPNVTPEDVKKLKDDTLKKLKDLANSTDEEFARSVYKELITTNITTIKLVQAQMEIDMTPRYVEVLAGLTSSTTSATDSLRDINKVKHNQDIDNKKIEVKQKAIEGGIGNTTNIVFSGGLKDLLRAVKEEEKTVEVLKIKEEE